MDYAPLLCYEVAKLTYERSMIIDEILGEELKKDLNDINTEIILYLQRIRPFIENDDLDEDDCLAAINEIYENRVNKIERFG